MITSQASPHQQRAQSSYSRDAEAIPQTSLVETKVSPQPIFKGPKRKRLVKACDACHKSKRRCDGTAPCSNCYFAVKECTYTDSAGRPVPAPNASRPDAIIQQQINNSGNIQPGAYDGFTSYTSQLNSSAPDGYHAPIRVDQLAGISSSDPSGSFLSITPLSASSTSQYYTDGYLQARELYEIEQTPRETPRKRSRNEHDLQERHTTMDLGIQSSSIITSSSGQDFQQSVSRSTHNTNSLDFFLGYDKNTIHELVNLFFAHCHPHRLIIHFTSFYNNFVSNRVPQHLLYAVCALAAPLSKSPGVRVNPVREAGLKFADAAVAILFDSSGNLRLTEIEAAQSLVLLQAYKIYREGDINGRHEYFELALPIIMPLRGFSSSDQHAVVDQHAVMAQPPSTQIPISVVDQECARRTFWLIHFIELMGAIFVRREVTHSSQMLDTIRLPCDEGAFELSAHSTLPEYLTSPAPRTRNASEFGHLIRISKILQEIEEQNVELPDIRAITDCENRLEEWTTSLAEHLKYDKDNLQMQSSLWETNTNSSAWCYCFMHIVYACCVFALSDIRKRLRQGAMRDHQSALAAVPAIMNAIGSRARNSILMGIVLWLQYCGPHAPQRRTDDGPAEMNQSITTTDTNENPAMHMLSKAPNIPELQPHLEQWLKEWEEFWGPPTHGHGHNNVSGMKSSRSPTLGPASITHHVNSQSPETMPGSQFNVPDLVIDPALTGSPDLSLRPTLPASPAVSSSSRGYESRSLPSLKSSGLLDVGADDQMGRSSGTSTPSKPSWCLSVAVSPRPPLLSPGLTIPAVSNSSGGSLASPHSPGAPRQCQLSPYPIQQVQVGNQASSKFRPTEPDIYPTYPDAISPVHRSNTSSQSQFTQHDQEYFIPHSLVQSSNAFSAGASNGVERR